MDWRGRLAGAAVVLSVIGLSSGLTPPPAGVVLIVVAVAAAWRWMPRFWRTLAAGVAGGAIAGLLILGPGFRVAMRVVAVLDPTRATELTVEGTMFIVIGIGGMMGGMFAAGGNLLRRAIGIESPVVAGTVLALALMAQFVLASGDISDEFFELGAGPWVNIPMFTAFAVGYGIAAMAIADRVLSEKLQSRRSDREKVAA